MYFLLVVKVHDYCQNFTWNGHSCKKLENFDKSDLISIRNNLYIDRHNFSS